MVEFILKIVFVFFCIIGLSDALHFLKQLILRSETKVNYTVTVDLYDNQIDQLNSILDEYRWSKKIRVEDVRIICCGFSDDVFSECERLAKIYGVKIFKK